MYTFIIEFFYLQRKIYRFAIFISKYRSKKQDSSIFFSKIEELYYRGIHQNKSTSIIEISILKKKYKDIHWRCSKAHEQNNALNNFIKNTHKLIYYINKTTVLWCFSAFNRLFDNVIGFRLLQFILYSPNCFFFQQHFI